MTVNAVPAAAKVNAPVVPLIAVPLIAPLDTNALTVAILATFRVELNVPVVPLIAPFEVRALTVAVPVALSAPVTFNPILVTHVLDTELNNKEA